MKNYIHTRINIYWYRATAVSIGQTTNTAGIVTTILPSTVFAKVIDENKFELYTRPEYVSSGAA